MLEGVRIVEICAIGPGPFCGMHLADLGADVIAVEREETQSMPQTVLNRGKRSIIANLKTAEGRALVLGLVARADALIEGMRPGVMERLALGPVECAAVNPRLVYGRVTGWGQTGPLAQSAGHDNNYIAVSGALYYSGTGEPPSAPITVIGDVGGGAHYLALGILAGILKARTTGRGTVVDASVVDGSAHMMQLVTGMHGRGLITGVRGSNMHDASHFFATYRCADGEHVTVGAMEPQFYALLLEKLELQDDPRYQDQWDRSRWPSSRREFSEIFAKRARGAWIELLEGSDVCFGAVMSPEEAARHPHNNSRGTWFERDGLLQSLPSPRFDGDVRMPGRMPQRGQHSDLIREALVREGPDKVWIDHTATSR